MNMNISKDSPNNAYLDDQEHAPSRPSFSSHVTLDRLRESEILPSASMVSKIRKGRKSIFKEMGLSDEDEDERISTSFDGKEMDEKPELPSQPLSPSNRRGTDGNESSKVKTGWLSKLALTKRPRIKTAASAPPPPTSGLHRLSMIAVLIAIIIPTISYNNGRKKVEISGADAGVIRQAPTVILEDRQDSPDDVCLRWGAQSAMVNGILYYYGGRSKATGDQTSDQWNNDFLTLDLTKSWGVGSPVLSALPQPSGPPAVSLGYLWNDAEHLFLYGGQFSDNPIVQPAPVSTWMYDIASGSWTEFQDPRTSAGNYSDPEGLAVQRASEGAGISVPELGLSWYFGGHLDWATTPGWSNQIRRLYLKGLLEFTHPGFANPGVDSLHASGAPDGGAYRNITQGGIQNEQGFTERADGVIVYVPGWGPAGILLGLGGGVVLEDDTSASFASMSTIDVFDIQTSEWYHQQTSGDAPQVRVNPCAVVFSAPDASSFNIYMYGGQNLAPVEQQIQYTDMWILTVPSFTWIKVDTTNGNEPPARSGHECAARDGQITVVGGYIGNNTNCDRPGVHVYDASQLQWADSFTAGDHPADANSDNTVLAGSYGYKVPDAVQSVIGGSSDGGATATQPASGPATDGPFKTGTPPVFTITAPGSTATVTGPSGNQPGSDSSGSSGGTIAAGIIAGLAGLAAIYLGFCAWLYRRQVKAYKRHMAVANSYSGANAEENYKLLSPTSAAAGGGVAVSEKLKKNSRQGSSRGSGGDEAGEQFGWVGQFSDPARMFGKNSTSDEPSPGSGSNYSSVGGRQQQQQQPPPRPSEERTGSNNPWGWPIVNGGRREGNESYLGAAGVAGAGVDRSKSDASRATRSTTSGRSVLDGLLDGRQPNFFSVVMGPRRALRVVNGLED